MEVVQLKKGGKVKRRRAKAKQPLQTQRQTVNIRMGGGGGGAMIGSTHTFSQPPQFYHAIREMPAPQVIQGDMPIRGQIQNADPVSGTSVMSNPQTIAPIPLNPNKTPPINPVRLFAPRGYIPRRPITQSPQRSPSTAKSVFTEHTDDIYPAQPLGDEPHDEYKMSEQGAVSATASSSASASGIGAQLVKPLSNPRGRPRKEAGAPTAPYNKGEGYIPPKYRQTKGGQ
jgi:hypothetical protein